MLSLTRVALPSARMHLGTIPRARTVPSATSALKDKHSLSQFSSLSATTILFVLFAIRDANYYAVFQARASNEPQRSLRKATRENRVRESILGAKAVIKFQLYLSNESVIDNA